MDYTLLCAGSLFTVGVADEDRDTASMTKMVAVPERTHKMAAPATGHIITAIHESSQVTLNRHASSRITADLHESRKSHSFSLGTQCLIESNQLTVVIMYQVKLWIIFVSPIKSPEGLSLNSRPVLSWLRRPSVNPRLVCPICSVPGGSPTLSAPLWRSSAFSA